MKLELFMEIINTMSLPTAINYQNVEQIDNEKKEQINKIIAELVNNNEEMFNNIGNNYFNSSKSAKSVLESIDNSEKQKIISETVNKLEEKKVIDYFLTSKFRNNSHSIIRDFDKHFLKQIKEAKKNIKNDNKEFRTNYKEVVTNSKRNYKVNDDGSINSKFIIEKINKLNKLIADVNKNILDNLNHINLLKKIQAVFVSLAIASSITASVLWALSIPTFGSTAPAATIASICATAFGAVASILKFEISRVTTSLKEFSKIFGLINAEGEAKNIVSYLSEIVKVYKNSKLLRSELLNNKMKFSSKALKVLSSIYDATKYSIQLHHIFKEINNISFIISQVDEQISFLVKDLQNMEKINWIVVNESPLDKPYDKGGKGGKNLHFKNLKTGEIKSISEMLEYSDVQLRLWNLQKVFNSKLNEWYIKTLPNKEKIDNLG